MKGVLAMAAIDEKFVYQGVHMQFKGEFGEPWGATEVRSSRLIFIGRNLNRQMLTEGFEACRNTHKYIADADIPTTTLRFGVGDPVRCRTAPDTYTDGVVAVVFHREPQFPPGLVVPYQVRLASGGAVYVPDDTDDFIRAPDAAQAVADGVAQLAVKGE